MISKKWLRYTLGVILGGWAGLGPTSIILPLVMSPAGMKEEFLIHWDLGGYAAHCVLAFAFGSWLTARVGRIATGPQLLGGTAIACGGPRGIFAYPGETSWILFMAVASGAYGTIGGLLLGHVPQKPADAHLAV